jgi:integrase
VVPPRLDTPLLFPAPEGGPLNLGNSRKRIWAPAVEVAGVTTPATPYDMRDTFASNALEGANVGIVGRLDALEIELERATDTKEAQR